VRILRLRLDVARRSRGGSGARGAACGARGMLYNAAARKGRIMQLRDVMTRDVDVVGPEAPIREAAMKMRALDVGPIPVCDGERLVGMLTDRDITVRAVAEGRDPNATPVRDVMTPEVAFCFEDQDVEQAASLMEQRQVRRIPVLNADKRLVGIVSLGDLALGTRDTERLGQTLEEVSAPAEPRR
jgi:CBS domain-containing protein